MRGTALPGQRSIFDQLHEKGIAHKIYSYKDSLTDAEILERAASDVTGGREAVYFLYLSELDMFLHLHRGEPERIEAKLAWYEEALGRVSFAPPSSAMPAPLFESFPITA